jgi:hypothetical protein
MFSGNLKKRAGQKAPNWSSLFYDLRRGFSRKRKSLSHSFIREEHLTLFLDKSRKIFEMSLGGPDIFHLCRNITLLVFKG